MNTGRVVLGYYMMGAVSVVAGALPWSEVGLVSVWLDLRGNTIVVNDSVVLGSEGMLTNLIGPVRSALGTIVGGALLAVWGAIDALIGFYAWPVTVMIHHDAPWEATLLAGAFVVAFTFAILKAFRPSV